jgi:microcystin-dependent protein
MQKVEKAMVLFPESLIATGMMLEYPVPGATAPTGFVWADGAAYDGNLALYAPLYGLYGTAFGNGGGAAGFFNVPNRNGRTPIGAGTGGYTEAFLPTAITAGTSPILVASNKSRWFTGMPVTFTTTGTAPGNLTNGAVYYVIRQSSTAIRLASTLANAQNNVAIVLSTQGTGTHTLTHLFTARVVGETGGEESHAMSNSELLAHNHSINATNSDTTTDTAAVRGLGTAAVADSSLIASVGGNAAMNIMQPFEVTRWVIKL